MNEQAKQKVLLGVFAVLVIAAGSFWFMSGSKTSMTTRNNAPLVRKVRSTDSSSKPNVKKVERSSRKTPTLERKERADVKRSDVRRKTRRTAGKKLEKKKKAVPAS